MQEKHEREIKQYKDFPYTLMGHSSLPTEYEIFLTGKGLKKIVNQMREGEDLRITIFANNKQSTFEIVDTHRKYSKQEANSQSNDNKKED